MISQLGKERGYIGHFNPSGIGADEKWQQWVLHLPKALWEMGCNNLPCSEVCTIIDNVVSTTE